VSCWARCTVCDEERLGVEPPRALNLHKTPYCAQPIGRSAWFPGLHSALPAPVLKSYSHPLTCHRLMSWPDPPSIYKLYTPESSFPPPAPPQVPADVTPENVGSFLPEHFARVYALPAAASREANGSLIIESNARVQALTSDMFKKLSSVQDDRCIVLE
jgi:hypothetical protein